MIAMSLVCQQVSILCIREFLDINVDLDTELYFHWTFCSLDLFNIWLLYSAVAVMCCLENLPMWRFSVFDFL